MDTDGKDKEGLGIILKYAVKTNHFNRMTSQEVAQLLHQQIRTPDQVRRCCCCIQSSLKVTIREGFQNAGYSEEPSHDSP